MKHPCKLVCKNPMKHGCSIGTFKKNTDETT